MKIYALVLIVLGLPIATAAQQIRQPASSQSPASTTKQPNPFDLSDAREQIASDSGLPTILRLKELEDRARAAFKSQDCKVALPLLDQYAKQANVMANLLRSGLQPFYKASY